MSRTQPCTCITCSGKWPADSVIPPADRPAVLDRAIQLFYDQAAQSPRVASETNTKDSEAAVSDLSGDGTGAPEVTEAMIKAGEEAILERVGPPDVPMNFSSRDLASRVYLAMDRMRRSSRS